MRTLRRAEEARRGQRADAATTGPDALNTGEVSGALLACAILTGLEEAHPGVLEDPELARRLRGLAADLLIAQRSRRRKALQEGGNPSVSETGVEPGTETGDEHDIPVP